MNIVNIGALDWKLLREQKGFLINEADNNAKASHVIEGIISLIDRIQDEVVRTGQATEKEVFSQ